MPTVIAYDGAPSFIKEDFKLDDKGENGSPARFVEMPFPRILTERQNIIDAGHFIPSPGNSLKQGVRVPAA